ncbi:hypothetical protein H312_01765 [Anncaliia algerae PRA339]|uniref:Uncharacterized protein n=1 Tax=Anncaliia algerae PRA339 TaxID=1288291 RepID=A0A059F0I9_9MICR|nr:hypothetical protein H312_01765 [Anncaliia algerae PRA339]
MIIPPDCNTKEREEHDISCLRVLYLLCEDISIDHDEHVQQAFLLLRKLIGQSSFQQEFKILQEFIEKQKRKKEFKNKKEILLFENYIFDLE